MASWQRHGFPPRLKRLLLEGDTQLGLFAAALQAPLGTSSMGQLLQLDLSVDVSMGAFSTVSHAFCYLPICEGSLLHGCMVLTYRFFVGQRQTLDLSACTSLTRLYWTGYWRVRQCRALALPNKAAQSRSCHGLQSK